MLALLDSDIVAYRCAATAENNEEWIAVARTKELVEQILHEVGADSYKLYLSGANNFRKIIYPDYKANRTQPRPKHLNVCKQYLVDHWGATWTDGYEADDALGINQEKTLEGNTIICSIDKDLRQIPGEHYNFVKKARDYISAETAIRTFYIQLLIGDTADNVRGKQGVGKAKAPKILDGCESEEELFNACRDEYKNDAEMLLNGQLLWIWRKMNEVWDTTKYGIILREGLYQMPTEKTNTGILSTSEIKDISFMVS